MTQDPTAISGTRRQYKEMADGTLRVQIDIDPAFKKTFLELFPTIDMPVAIAPLRADFERTASDATKDNIGSAVRPNGLLALKPYGKEAAELYRIGFFYNTKILKAIGTDEEFLEWIRQQPCAMTGEFDRNEDEHGNFILRCEAAHVRRIANGAGTAEKPPYSAIPLIHFWHDAQTHDGERVFHSGDPRRPNRGGDPIKGREWAEKKRNEYVIHWASHKLATDLGCSSMGHVEPEHLLVWAQAHDLQMFLPAVYKSEQTDDAKLHDEENGA